MKVVSKTILINRFFKDMIVFSGKVNDFLESINFSEEELCKFIQSICIDILNNYDYLYYDDDIKNNLFRILEIGRENFKSLNEMINDSISKLNLAQPSIKIYQKEISNRFSLLETSDLQSKADLLKGLIHISKANDFNFLTSLVNSDYNAFIEATKSNFIYLTNLNYLLNKYPYVVLWEFEKVVGFLEENIEFAKNKDDHKMLLNYSLNCCTKIKKIAR